MSATSCWLRRIALAILSTVCLTTVLATTAGSADAAQRHRRDSRIGRAVDIARNQIGDPYVYGAAGPGAFDCSGLTMFAFDKAGLSLPRTTSAQANAVRHIPRHQMKKGDLVFFSNGGSVYHVGIFLHWRHGRRVILHSPYPGKHVERERIWTSHWFAGTLRSRH